MKGKMKIPKKHKEIVEKLVKKYKSNKNVTGIYLFGSLAKGTATPKSDVDIEIIFKNRKKPYELLHKKVNGIKIDLSIYSLRKFEEDFSNKPYSMYVALGSKILYDPKGIIKKNLENIKKYFSKNKKIKKFLQKKEKKWKDAKKKGKTDKAENYFDIMEKLERDENNKIGSFKSKSLQIFK